MIQLIFSSKADEDFEALTSAVKPMFSKHFEKIISMPPRRHLKHGVSCFVENVGGQGRIIYQLEEEKIVVIRCFSDHKSYERWFRSYR